jgi:hypothetical protein
MAHTSFLKLMVPGARAQCARKPWAVRCALMVYLAVCYYGQNSTRVAKEAGWTLVWSDEFNGPNESAVDRSEWVLETGARVGATGS